MKLFNNAGDHDLFKFMLNFRVLYDFLKLPSDCCPFEQFSPIVLNWISEIGERMIQWITRAIAIDTFEIDNDRDRTSTSIGDMMQIFAQSVQFLRSMQWEASSVDAFIETFLSLCISAIKMYTEELTFKMLSFFPVKLVLHVGGNPNIFATYIPELRKVTKSRITPKQIFVIINNFMNLRPAWIRYLDTIREFFPHFSVSEVFANPVPQVTVISKQIPVLFAGLTSEMTTETVAPKVWVKNTKVKQLFRLGSVHVLNPLFEQRQSDLFVELFDKTVADVKTRLCALESTIARPQLRGMLQGFLHGLDTGLMNVLVFLPEARPIKRTRLSTLLRFFDDLLNDVKEYIVGLELDEFTDELFNEFTPLCHYIIAGLERDPIELIKLDPQESNLTLAMCNYLIIASAMENRDAVKWTKENRLRYTYRKFEPSFNPKLF
jgi:hypothetical protein